MTNSTIARLSNFVPLLGLIPKVAQADFEPKLTEMIRVEVRAKYLWGGQFENGAVTFNGFYLSRHGTRQEDVIDQ